MECNILIELNEFLNDTNIFKYFRSDLKVTDDMIYFENS